MKAVGYSCCQHSRTANAAEDDLPGQSASWGGCGQHALPSGKIPNTLFKTGSKYHRGSPNSKKGSLGVAGI